ncbi:MAG: hypothetical protein DWP97_03780 [Calditrichaeota bacterium]|nr:MAG: hypothetical protein DWP97_03780 [Calditrichota bacterium]
MQMKKCVHCGNENIDTGWILSAGKIAYKSDKLKYPLEGGNVRSFVCTKCGYLESYVSEEYLDKIE